MPEQRWSQSAILATTVAAAVVLALVAFGSTPSSNTHSTHSTRSTAADAATRASPRGTPSWPAPTPRRNVVMSMAYNYPLKRFQVFVSSLRQSGFTGDIILFTNMTADAVKDKKRGGRADDPRIIPFLEANGVEWHDAANLDKDLTWMHPKLQRYHLYAKHAARPEFQSSLILLVDFRDVVFQADPFDGVQLRGEWLRFYEELYPPSMKASAYTYEWIRECWGEEAAKRVEDAIIVCSGATMGTSEGIVHYSRTMSHAVQTAPRPVCADHDQRYHNYLLYNGGFQRVRTLRAGHAEVYNLGYIGKHNRTATGSDPARFRHIDDIVARHPDGTVWVVLNEDGRVAPVLHQYDRVPELERTLEGRYISV